MARDEERAAQLKNEGNKHFQNGDFVGAESLYSKAIIQDDTNPALYTNRARTRLKLGFWDSAITDCESCLRLSESNMKAHYIMAEAHVELRNFEDALAHAVRAHKLCAITNDKSLPQVTALVLRCKKERWDEAEKKRAREGQELENELLGLLGRERDDMLATCDNDGDRTEVDREWAVKMDGLRATFEAARSNAEKNRVVPDWAIDDISFGIMVDPVMTKTGKSYERASIMEHMRRHQTDPLTREPLQPQELRPNLGLKQACEEFLEQNGWAVDW